MLLLLPNLGMGGTEVSAPVVVEAAVQNKAFTLTPPPIREPFIIRNSGRTNDR